MDISQKGAMIFLPFAVFGFLAILFGASYSNKLLIELSLPVGLGGFFVGFIYVYLKAKKLDNTNVEALR